MEIIQKKLHESCDVIGSIIGNNDLLNEIQKIAFVIIDALKKNGKIFFAGNGGSAADAQHLAAELVSKFYMERKGLAAEALSVNTSVLTAIGNDYGFDRVFARQIEANAKKGDIFVGISTSGNSKNIIEAVRECKKIDVKTIIFTGISGGLLKDICDVVFKVPSSDTPRIQECHILIGHIICEIVEREMFR